VEFELKQADAQRPPPIYSVNVALLVWRWSIRPGPTQIWLEWRIWLLTVEFTVQSSNVLRASCMWVHLFLC